MASQPRGVAMQPVNVQCPKGKAKGGAHDWRTDETCAYCDAKRCGARLAQRGSITCALARPCRVHAQATR